MPPYVCSSAYSLSFLIFYLFFNRFLCLISCYISGYIKYSFLLFANFLHPSIYLGIRIFGTPLHVQVRIAFHFFFPTIFFYRFSRLISSYISGYIYYSFIPVVNFLFEYLSIYLGIRFFWHATLRMFKCLWPFFSFFLPYILLLFN
jgi:hypothetical protein